MTQYHTHLTVSNITEIPKGWKKTVILLENDQQSQTDIMLTKHYKLGCKDIYTVPDILRDISQTAILLGSNLIRAKVEQDNNFHLPISENNYVEIHMLCPIDTELDSSWVRSRNPKNESDGIKNHFLNKRIYSGKCVEQVVTEVVSSLGNTKYSEFKVEQVIYDSNAPHDKWWA